MNAMKYFFMLMVLALTASVQAQTGRTIRWQEGGPNSDKLIRGSDVVAKQLVVDGVSITVSVRDIGLTYRADISVVNGGQNAFDIRPETIAFEASRPVPKYLSQQTPQELGRAAQLSSDTRAAMKELSGSMATKTVTKTTTTWSDSVSSGLPGNRSDPPHLVTHTTVSTVPDDDARSRAKMEADVIRRQGFAESRSFIKAALKPTTVSPNASASGAVFFRRDDKVEDVVLRVPMDGLIIEVPFHAVVKRRFLAFKAISFE